MLLCRTDQHLQETLPSVTARRWAPETDPQWGPRHLDSIRKRPLEPVEPLQSGFGTSYWFVWPEGNCPQTEPGFSQGFFSILSLMEFWFLAAVASGLLSWGHFISSDIINLISQIFTNFQAALFGWFILAVIPCLHTQQKQKKPSKKHLKRCKLIYSGIRPSHQPYTAHLTEYTVNG